VTTARISTVYSEVFDNGTPTARVSTVYTEVFTSASAPAEVSKLNAYAVMINKSAQASKVNAYAVLYIPPVAPPPKAAALMIGV
jgi:hypothetical protein